MNKIGFDYLADSVRQQEKRKKVAIAAAHDSHVLKALCETHTQGIADGILVGNKDKIERIAIENKLSLDGLEIIDERDENKAAMKAVSLVHFGEADMFMKGLMETKNFLKVILNKEVGLRTNNLLSHVCVFDLPTHDHLIFLTDVAFIPYPTLEEKIGIVKNAVKVAQACGISVPKVAMLSAIEIVNPKMQCTVEAETLSKMNDNGEITGCIIDGPLSFDLATIPESAIHKAATGRKIVGDADILVFPDIHAGNITYKCMSHMVPHRNGCILTGTMAPTILTSRSDDMQTKVNSIILAAAVADKIKTRDDN